jgi:hypothetical protein
MKLTAIASAALSVMVLILGLLFMLYELPYSNYILVISLLLLAVSLIIFYNLDKEKMYIAGAIFCLLPIMGLMFTQLNLPGAKLLLTTGLILFGLFFVPWFAIKSFKG